MALSSFGSHDGSGDDLCVLCASFGGNRLACWSITFACCFQCRLRRLFPEMLKGTLKSRVFRFVPD